MPDLAYLLPVFGAPTIGEQRAILLKYGQISSFSVQFLESADSSRSGSRVRFELSKLVAYATAGDQIYVASIAYLGINASDVLDTVCVLLEKKATINVPALGRIDQGCTVVEAIQQLCAFERSVRRIGANEGRAVAISSLASTGLTQHGKRSLGRPVGRVADQYVNPSAVATWRRTNNASISVTARHWKLSSSTVKRYCAANKSENAD